MSFKPTSISKYWLQASTPPASTFLDSPSDSRHKGWLNCLHDGSLSAIACPTATVYDMSRDITWYSVTYTTTDRGMHRWQLLTCSVRCCQTLSARASLPREPSSPRPHNSCRQFSHSHTHDNFSQPADASRSTSHYRPRSRGDNTSGSVHVCVSVCLWVLSCLNRWPWSLAWGSTLTLAILGL